MVKFNRQEVKMGKMTTAERETAVKRIEKLKQLKKSASFYSILSTAVAGYGFIFSHTLMGWFGVGSVVFWIICVTIFDTQKNQLQDKLDKDAQ